MRRDAQRGAALALVLWGLVVGGALLTVTVVLVVEEQRAADATASQQRAFVAAETGAVEALSGLTAGALLQRLRRPFDSLALPGGRWGTALVRRLTGRIFLLDVAARVETQTRAAATVRLGWLVRAEPESLTPAAAASVGAAAFLGNDVTVSGVDEPPPGRGACPPADSAIPGILASVVSLRGSATVAGRPPLVSRALADSGLAPSDLRAFRRFTSRATVVLSGGTYETNPATVGTSCDLQEVRNWGDPRGDGNPCAAYAPVVKISGGLTLAGGIGHGILLVDGDLRVTGDYEFDGLVFVTGSIEVSGRLLVRGAVAAAGLGSEAGQLSQVEVRYSKCIISNVLQSSSSLHRLPSRAWKQLFQAP